MTDMKAQALKDLADLKAWTVKHPVICCMIGSAVLIFLMGVWAGSL